MKVKYKACRTPPKAWTPDGEWLDFAMRGGMSIMVFEDEPAIRPTGLFDPYGTQLYAFEQYINPIGFFQFEEEDD